jgi:lipopolysaccharide/colanic/teichoic acid biosynthesis glycosyltransferase
MVPARLDNWTHTLDVLVITLALPVLAALFLLISLAVRLDSPGPILIAQQEVGRDGRRFRRFRFRTMVRNASELPLPLIVQSVVPPPDFKIPEDPRLTRVGKFFRGTRLHQLPQCINVLRGELSLFDRG